MVAQQSSPNRFWPRCIFLVIIVIIIIFIWCRFLPFPCLLCPPDDVAPPEKSGPAAQIVIDDARASVWMATYNDYLDPGDMWKKAVCTDSKLPAVGECAQPTSSNPVHGVMFQFGELHGTDDSWTQTLEQVEIISAIDPADYDLEDPSTVESAVLKVGEFDWLDVNPFEECVIDPYFAYALFMNPHVELSCDETPWDPCRRNRSLHSSLKPTSGLMTYWSGNAGYDVNAAVPLGEKYPAYTFDLHDPIAVEQWLAGCFLKRYEHVVRINVAIRTTGTTPGSVFDDPPTDGGVHTYP